MNSHFLCILAVAFSLGLTGCASTGTSQRVAPSSAPENKAAQEIGNAPLGTSLLVSGLSSSSNGESQQVTVINEYFAASNNLCRRFRIEGTSQLRIACKDDRGNWSIVRSLFPSESATINAIPESASVNTSLTGANVGLIASNSEGFLVQSTDEVMLGQDSVADSAIVSFEFPQTTDFQQTTDQGQILSDAEPATAAAMQQTRDLKVEAGETLWRFSRRVTGTGTNWGQIAETNNLAEPYRIRSGQILSVSENLLLKSYRGG